MTKILISAFALILLTSANLYATTPTLRFIGDQNFVTGEKFQETEIGGLSGLVYDKKTSRILAVSDDRGKVNETRFYEFDIVTLTDKSFQVKPVAVVKFKEQNGNYFKGSRSDFEGISMTNDGDVLISSEGPYKGKSAASPEFLRFSRTGEFKEAIALPAKFLPPKKNEIEALSGARDNKSLEALSSTPDGKTTFVGMEEALYQDGEMSTISYASTSRIIIYKDLKPVKEVAYKLEKIESTKAAPTQKSADLSPPDTGLTDIAAIDDNNFYAMERTYIPFANTNIIRIFKCTITDKTTDVSDIASLKNATYVTVDKELVADLSDFTSKMNPHELDNIEGIAFGPALANGNPTLIVVSDNNFGKGQRTLFMAFEVINKSK
ncbi:MAG: esterase-like activity of phytase family protein [Rhizobacter sp.]|nr:esterase-like activity of phytase family protein [Bacteriovorax sp.]